ncbi:hypothetical protein HO133_001880 [Letharia lupina]|uniref:Uncharacterized protein n=1 Tax=Letharia lupina TaxID=560253 RepID=A0A8H6CED0_9LECA|nr:uncharacterized protein HO133_001880 [Letharia lupina]KAF6221912.1 hypothetical protein HO133_001880 [Letharia lupina]
MCIEEGGFADPKEELERLVGKRHHEAATLRVRCSDGRYCFGNDTGAMLRLLQAKGSVDTISAQWILED